MADIQHNFEVVIGIADFRLARGVDITLGPRSQEEPTMHSRW